MNGTATRARVGRPRGSANVGADARIDYHALNGDRGIIGTGRNAVAYVWDARNDHYHVAPARAYSREPMTYGRERAIVRFAPRDTVGTGDVRTRAYDPWDGTRHILPDAPYVGGEAWRAAQRARVRNAPTTRAHTCARETVDRMPSCDCDAFGGAKHDHRTDDGIDVTQAPRLTYAEVIARIDARERLHQ